MKQMQQMMGGMLGGMETRLGRANEDLQQSLTGQIGRAMDSIGSLNERMSVNERKLDDVVSNIENTVEKKVEEGIRRLAAGRPMGFGEHDFPDLPVGRATRPPVSPMQPRPPPRWLPTPQTAVRPPEGNSTTGTAVRLSGSARLEPARTGTRP